MNQNMYWVVVSFDVPQIHTAPIYASSEENAREIVSRVMQNFRNTEIIQIAEVKKAVSEDIEKQMEKQLELPLEEINTEKRKLN